MKSEKELKDIHWLLLSKLLAKRMSIKDCLDQLYQMYPLKRIKEIQEKMDEGESLPYVLNGKGLEKNIGFYCRYISLRQAIEVAYEERKQKSRMQKDIYSKLAYPLILFISSMAVLFLFTDMVLPSMLESLSLDVETNLLVMSFRIINALKNMILLCIFILIILFSYIILRKKQCIVWAFLHRLHKDRVIKIIATYQLVNDLKILLGSGCHLSIALEVIRYNDKKPLAAMLAAHFHSSLMGGIDFEHSLEDEFFDEGFHSICLWGIKDDDFEASLADYKEIIEMKTMNLIKEMSLMIQTICYLFVIVIIMLAYRVLLLPLELLNSF